jgi:hypothetical protein
MFVVYNMFFNLNTDFVGSTNTINICFILLTIYLVIPVSGCLVMCPSATNCTIYMLLDVISNEVDDVIKTSEMVCASSESDPLPHRHY